MFEFVCINIIDHFQWFGVHIVSQTLNPICPVTEQRWMSCEEKVSYFVKFAFWYWSWCVSHVHICPYDPLIRKLSKSPSRAEESENKIIFVTTSIMIQTCFDLYLSVKCSSEVLHLKTRLHEHQLPSQSSDWLYVFREFSTLPEQLNTLSWSKSTMILFGPFS